jgi:hypothetical protein
MSDDATIFEHVMRKEIGKAEFRREIVVLEEGPFVFRVVQDQHLSQNDIVEKRKAAILGVPGRFEWICQSKEAAIEQALKCLHQSKIDQWLFLPSASSAA